MNDPVRQETPTLEEAEWRRGERSEPSRNGASSNVARDAAGPGVPDPEVLERPRRRRFSAEYKLDILGQADACKRPGDVAALLRREGLYSSHLSTWRRQRDEGALKGLRSKKRGRKAQVRNPLAPRVAELERENRQLQNRLQQAQTIIEVQKKLSAVLGIPLESSESEESD
jgi:transposase